MIIIAQAPSATENAKEEITSAWDRTQLLIDNTIARLPSIILAIVVFIVFFFLARGIKLAIRRVTRHRRNARSLGMVLGRLAQGTIILIGAFVAMTIIIPSFKVGDLVQLVGNQWCGSWFCFPRYFAKFPSWYFNFTYRAF